jgi:hypothetical protein
MKLKSALVQIMPPLFALALAAAAPDAALAAKSTLSLEKNATVEMKKRTSSSSHSVGLLTYFDAQTPGEANTLGLESRGKLDFPDGKILNGLGYSARIIANDKKRVGSAQVTAKPAFLPKIVSVQGRAQGAHAKDKLKMQYDLGPVVELLKTEVAGVNVSAQFTERMHIETPLLEHETTLKAGKGSLNVTLQGTATTPLVENAQTTAKLYAEVAKDFGHNRFQALIGAMTGGKPSDWKNAAQVFTGVRMAM